MTGTTSITELAALLGVHRSTIYRMNKAGELPLPLPIKRRKVRWRSDDIELWLSMDCPPANAFSVLKQTKQRFAKRR